MPAKPKTVRESIIAQGVANLKEFGYPSVNADNILTDRVYKAFFIGILEANEGKHEAVGKLLKELRDAR